VVDDEIYDRGLVARMFGELVKILARRWENAEGTDIAAWQRKLLDARNRLAPRLWTPLCSLAASVFSDFDFVFLRASVSLWCMKKFMVAAWSRAYPWRKLLSWENL